MRKIIFFLSALFAVYSSNAQIAPAFRARLEREPAGTGGTVSYAVYLKLSGTSPFTAGNNRFIGTAQFPIAVTKTQASPGGLTVTMDPTFLNSMVLTSNGSPDYDITVNPLVSTCHTANAGEHYFSVNLSAGSQVTGNIIPAGVEFKIMTVTFTGGNVPNPDSVKLLNVSYRLAPMTSTTNNQQCQLAIEDNWANEYTDPFSNIIPLFYDKPGNSVSESAGTIVSNFYGWLAGDYNSWSRTVSDTTPKGENAYNPLAASKTRLNGVVDEVALTSNPINDGTKLHITASVDQRIEYQVVDAAGRLVSRQSLDVREGAADYDFENLSMLSAGTYYLTTRGTTLNTALKLIKK